MRCNPLAPTLLLSLLILASTQGSATTYVMITDDELLSSADAVVRGSVVALSAEPEGALPATAYLLEVEEEIAGYVPASSLEVRISGGLDPMGDSWVVWGAPQFQVGEQLLLFLEEREDGSWQVLHSSLGAFREINTPQGRFVTRDLGSAHEVKRLGDSFAAERARSHQPRELSGFTSWMRARSAGVDSPADYFVESVPAPSSVLKYRLIGSGTQSPPNGCGSTGGHPIRVFGFDRGDAFHFDAHVSGQPGIAGGGFAQLQSAMKAWNRDSGSNINLNYTGTTNDTPQAGSTRQTVLWNDPRDEIPGSFSGGGILAQTVTGFRCDLDPFANGTAHPIGGALIVIQSGLESFLSGNSNPEAALEEILGHELGHAIGLGHSCENSCSGAAGDALMAARVHSDGRGASLGSDDRAGVAFLYPASSDGDDPSDPEPDPGDGGGSNGGSSSKKPARPTNLSAPAVSTSSVTLEWKDRSGNEETFVIERRSATGGWTVVTTSPANSSSKKLSGLAQATYHVFRVSAKNSKGSSYSNEIGVTTKATLGNCLANAQTVCLNSNRFRVTIDFLTQQGDAGEAKGERYSNDTGLFSFFNTSNLELTIKVLDGCAWGHFWVFAAGMTNLETVVTVSDMKTGNTKSYVNPQGSAFSPIQDTSAFACQ